MTIRQQITDFMAQQGRRPRVLVAGDAASLEVSESKRLASALADTGFDVDLAPNDPNPLEIARQAIENDVHAVVTYADTAALRSELASQGVEDIVVVAATELSVDHLLTMIDEVLL